MTNDVLIRILIYIIYINIYYILTLYSIFLKVIIFSRFVVVGTTSKLSNKKGIEVEVKLDSIRNNE